MTRYDIIGDIHGCAAELETLLGELGYRRDEFGVHRHPERTAVFVGDLVDRGPGQLEALQMVKGMVDAGSAFITMGNHEFNAVCFATPDPNKPGDFLRTHQDPKNKEGHLAFLDQLSDEDRAYYLDWFMTLPLWLELDGPEGQTLRVIHACWHEPSMQAVRRICGSDRLLTVENFVEAATKGTDLYEAVETLLKGPEISLTDLGHEPYYDHIGKKRTKARVRWWDQDARTLVQIADVRGMKTKDGLEYPRLPDDEVDGFDFSLIYTDPVPVIYGHYWFEWDSHREDWTEHTACVDFSAVKAGGKLVAYRWDGGPITWQDYVPHTADIVSAAPSD